MPFTKFGFIKMSPDCMNNLTQCNITDVSGNFPEHNNWLKNYFLNKNFGGNVSTMGDFFANFILRRAEIAFEEYKKAEENVSAFIKNRNPILYYDSLNNIELTISAVLQSHIFISKVTAIDFYPQVDTNTKYFRIRRIYNDFRHIDDLQELTKDAAECAFPAWLTNDGVKSKDHQVSYHEIEEMISEIGNIANDISKAGK